MERTRAWFEGYSDLMKARAEMAKATSEVLRLRAEREQMPWWEAHKLGCRSLRRVVALESLVTLLRNLRDERAAI